MLWNLFPENYLLLIWIIIYLWKRLKNLLGAGERKQKMNIAAVFAVVNPEGNLIIEERNG